MSALRTHTNESEEMERDIPCKFKWGKKSQLEILISDTIDFKIKTVARYKEEYYIMIKRSTQ